MFLWIELDWRKHPHLDMKSTSSEGTEIQLSELEARIATKALANGVLVTKGSLFSTNKNFNGQLHFRMTFAAAPEHDLQEGVRLFAITAREEFSFQC